MNLEKIFESVLKEAKQFPLPQGQWTYKDVVRLTGANTEGDNIGEVFARGAIDEENAIQPLMNHSEYATREDAEDYLNGFYFNEGEDNPAEFFRYCWYGPEEFSDEHLGRMCDDYESEWDEDEDEDED